ncbi:hypothetical protein NUSPORA_02340 [Nucleospora cyclopteri]
MNNNFSTKYLRDALNYRKELLIKLNEIIYKYENQPSIELIRNIAIQMKICENPEKMKNPSRIKVDFIETAQKEVEIKEGKQKICPLSQAEIVNKYEAPCGHIFDRESIKQYLKNKKARKCPVLGCEELIKKGN